MMEAEGSNPFASTILGWKFSMNFQPFSFPHRFAIGSRFRKKVFPDLGIRKRGSSLSAADFGKKKVYRVFKTFVIWFFEGDFGTFPV